MLENTNNWAVNPNSLQKHVVVSEQAFQVTTTPELLLPAERPGIQGTVLNLPVPARIVHTEHNVTDLPVGIHVQNIQQEQGLEGVVDAWD